MTITNHALVGATIIAIIPNPWIALPLAIGSHFLLDAVPHFGGVDWFEHWGWPMAMMAAADLVLLIGLCVVLAFIGGAEAGWLITGALAATLPDWPWLLHYGLGWQHAYFRWHLAIQRYERPWGAYVEVVFGALMATGLWRLLGR